MSLIPDGTVLPLDRLPTRREFCQGLCAGGVALVTIAGCGGEPAAPTDGGKTDLTTPPAEDMTTAPTPDMSTSPEDLAQAPGADLTDTRDMTRPPDMVDPNACPALGLFKTNMKPAAFALNTATAFIMVNTFVCRDAGGLYALTAICTHAGCSVEAVNNGAGGFACPCHGSRFSFTGSVTNGPAGAPLEHYALCLDGNGNVGINTLSTVASNKRYSF